MRQRTDTEANHEPAPQPERRWLVRFKCPECGVFTSGWLTQIDSAPRICKGNARLDTKRVSLSEVCGAVMVIVHDER